VILGKPNFFPCSSLEDRFTPSSRLSPPFLTLDEEVGPSLLRLILSASSLPGDLYLFLDYSHFAGDIQTVAGGTQEREAGERSHGMGEGLCGRVREFITVG
jgi:hypothetical protein